MNITQTITSLINFVKSSNLTEQKRTMTIEFIDSQIALINDYIINNENLIEKYKDKEIIVKYLKHELEQLQEPLCMLKNLKKDISDESNTKR